MRPQSAAVVALTFSASRAIRAALALPMAAGTSIEAPPSGMRPILVKASMNPADSLAIARSAATAIEQPTPAAMPFTAATTTTEDLTIASTSRLAASRVSRPGGEPSGPTSAPELKARPEPVTTITRTPESSAFSTASAAAWRISAVTEFSRSGRSKVMRRASP